MAKREVKNATIDYSGDARETIFGWCCTGQHEDCTVEFVGHTCVCECHKRESKTNAKEDT